ncbi:hypothetical protein LCGC14_0293830 [marine sediment metagenome]|uniref:Uncharacterized protein n=1 Tax=marine sediment metagenome TaxID=412755 RepID=A0A0F9U994_9ZZZZ
MPRYQLLANTDIIQHSKIGTMGTKKNCYAFLVVCHQKIVNATHLALGNAILIQP